MCNSECTRRLYDFYGGGITCGCEAIDLGSGSKIQFLCEEKQGYKLVKHLFKSQEKDSECRSTHYSLYYAERGRKGENCFYMNRLLKCHKFS